LLKSRLTEVSEEKEYDWRTDGCQLDTGGMSLATLRIHRKFTAFRAE